MTNPNCPICFRIGFFCENHPDRAWSEELGCQCGAGEPCACNRSDDIDQGLEVPEVSHFIPDAGVKKQRH